MDLVKADSKKAGTRGGRAQFTWESVNNDERQYYLGNSVAKRSNATNSASRQDFDWYNKPPPASASTSAPQQPVVANTVPENAVNDLQAVRRKEKAMMEQMIVGRSFSDAVRSALTESVGSGVDDEGTRIDAAAAAARRAVRRREKHEKAQRKEMRRRVRELRRVRRAERHKRRDKQQNPQHDSSESERESVRSRMQDDTNRRRRRRGRDHATRRKRSEWSSTSDSDDSDGHRSRRQRLR